jgi:hypothetical protein
MKRADRIDNLFDYLADHPEGVTKHAIASDQEMPPARVSSLVQGLRDLLADVDTINVTCESDPADPHGPWRYRLAGKMADFTIWHANRIGDIERRVRTLLGTVTSIANGADMASVDGRKARVMRKGFARLVEDLDDITR